eukprot:g29228.t1
MGDGVAVHFAEVLRKMPVPGELVRQLAQLDSALTPCPTALMAALARWPRRAKPTAALMANLQRARSSHFSGAAAALPQLEQAAEVLASLHETRGDVETAARLLARAKSPRVFPLLKKHLPAGAQTRDLLVGSCNASSGHFSGAAAALPQLVALDTAEAIRLAAEFPSTFPPADVLAALVPLGECWELRYLRILSETAPDVANLGRLVELMAALQPHRLASLLDKLLQEQAVGAQEALEVSWAAGALDASAVAVAALGHTREAFDLLLQQGLSKALELEGKAQGDAFELKEHLLTLAAQDVQALAKRSTLVLQVDV